MSFPSMADDNQMLRVVAESSSMQTANLTEHTKSVNDRVISLDGSSFSNRLR
jgi:hypothetical protein